MNKAADSHSTISPETVLEIVRKHQPGPMEVSPRMEWLAETLSWRPGSNRPGRAPMTGPEFDISKRLVKALLETTAELAALAAWQTAVIETETHPALRDDAGSERQAILRFIEEIKALAPYDFIQRAHWAAQKPIARMRLEVASQVARLLAEERGQQAELTAEAVDARVLRITTELLQASAEPGADFDTVKQTVVRFRR